MPEPRERGSRRGPRELTGALARLRRQAAPPTLLARVQEGWVEAAGARVSEQASPVSERDGVVTVRCRSSVWSAELSLLSQTLLESLNRRLEGGRQVRGLRFTTEPR